VFFCFAASILSCYIPTQGNQPIYSYALNVFSPLRAFSENTSTHLISEDKNREIAKVTPEIPQSSIVKYEVPNIPIMDNAPGVSDLAKIKPEVEPVPDAKDQSKSVNKETAFAPSFNCNNVTRGIEVLICGDRELSKIDVDLSQAYQEKMERTTNKNLLKSDQINWLKKSARACSDKDCLMAAYTSRLQELRE
jgi:uncharacterized protein YecT (DUF1311 family)